MSDLKRKHLLPATLFVVWLIFTAVAFWWFQFRHISRFDAYFAEFNGQELREASLKSSGQMPLVVHFVADDCPCSKFADPHLAQLELDFQNHAEFVSWGDNDPRLEFLREVTIPAGPAVAIWSAEGELAYFGPYSSGYFCGEGDDFVQVTLNKLKAGENPLWINHDALGCFCPWTESL